MGSIGRILNKRFLFGSKGISRFVICDGESVVSEYSKVNSFCRLLKAELDSYTYVGSFSILNNVRCGKYCSISRNNQIGLGSHPSKFLSSSPLFYRRFNGTGQSWVKSDKWDDSAKKTVIGNDVWIGINVIIPGGVTIGNGAIIAANSVVVKDVEPYTIVGGVPAKVIKNRFSEEIVASLERLKWWDLPPRTLKSHLELFHTEIDEKSLKKIIVALSDPMQ